MPKNEAAWLAYYTFGVHKAKILTDAKGSLCIQYPKLYGGSTYKINIDWMIFKYLNK